VREDEKGGRLLAAPGSRNVSERLSWAPN